MLLQAWCRPLLLLLLLLPLLLPLVLHVAPIKQQGLPGLSVGVLADHNQHLMLLGWLTTDLPTAGSNT
jgi:hypothetical protein